MANIQIYKNHSEHFALAITVSEIVKFKMFEVQKVGQAQSKIFALRPSMANVKIHKRPLTLF